MNKTIVIIILTLIIGITGGILIHKRISKQSINNITTFEEVLKIKELHLIKHVYQDLSFIHKENDPNKTMRAIALVPVEVSAYINLNEVKIDKKQDSILCITLPEPDITVPNYQVDKMDVKDVRNFQVHIGKDLHAEVLRYLKEIASKRKEAIVKLAIENGILDETKQEAENYIHSLLKVLVLNDAPIEFIESPTKSDSIEEEQNNMNESNFEILSILPMENEFLYNPELIPVENID